MSADTMDFDWLLDHASVIAFDPARSSLYVFALEMSADQLRAQVLAPMDQAGLFTASNTQFIDADKRENYRGQLPRVSLSIFDLAGAQYGIVLSYHEKFKPDLAQYTAWLEFWHQRSLQAAQTA